ncbi:hypothetical protein [Streptomyces xiamenensis]|uniref:hypothetical protein n=1 Tax=Streptomyces xiamenensis TaxID=408015 RepID=UPI003D71E2A6
MSDWDAEWAAAEAAAREEIARTRLNTHEGGGTGGNSGLTVTAGAKEGAAAYLEEELKPTVTREAALVMAASVRSAARMAGWRSAAGLAHASQAWEHKLSALGEWLELEAQALRGVSQSFVHQEAQIVNDLQAIRATPINGMPD